MCYSAIVQQHLHELARQFGSEVEWQMFEDLFFGRIENSKIKLARALEDSIVRADAEAARRIETHISVYREQTVRTLEQKVFKEKKRLADAERILATKPTKKAAEDRRIAPNEIEKAMSRLADLKRSGVMPGDSRIFPFWYAPVIVQEGDRRFIRPMRYHCRPAGMPASLDVTHDGLYNARRESLGRFWRNLFGRTHALMVVSSFYENVKRHNYEHRTLAPGEKPQNMVLHFDPQPARQMLIACLWSHWERPGERPLNSFAAVTDDPPPEIAAAGHDRCIIALKSVHVGRVLAPANVRPERLQEILSDKHRFFYEHRIAA